MPDNQTPFLHGETDFNKLGRVGSYVLSENNLNTLNSANNAANNTPAEEAAEEQLTLPSAKDWFAASEARLLQAKQEQEQRVRTKRLGHLFGDLGQSISEMVNTWGGRGGVVMPRDVQKKYDDLDTQQRQIFDNYIARSEALQQQMRAEELQQQREAQQKKNFEAQQKEARQQRADSYLLKDRELKAAKEWHDKQYELGMAKLKNQYEIAKIRANQILGKDNNGDYKTITIGNDKYQLTPENLANVYAYMSNNGLLINESPLLYTRTTEGWNGTTTTSGKTSLNKFNTSILIADNIVELENGNNSQRETHLKEIIKRLGGGTTTTSTKTQQVSSSGNKKGDNEIAS